MNYSLRITFQVAMVAAAFTLLPGCGAQGQGGTANFSGTVLEATNASSYTYILVDTGKEKVWAAAPQFAAKPGDKVSFSKGMPMRNFESKTLNRKFDTLYFVGGVDTPGTKQPNVSGHTATPVPPGDDIHAGVRRAAAPPALDFAGIKPPEGGLTVAEVYQQKGALENKKVRFRGKVVKYNSEVMQRNWAHVRDGTGGAGSNDITVTTQNAAKVGDTVLVEGTLVLNKDFGHGYKYDLLVENAKLTVETPK